MINHDISALFLTTICNIHQQNQQVLHFYPSIPSNIFPSTFHLIIEYSVSLLILSTSPTFKIYPIIVWYK